MELLTVIIVFLLPGTIWIGSGSAVDKKHIQKFIISSSSSENSRKLRKLLCSLICMAILDKNMYFFTDVVHKEALINMEISTPNPNNFRF